MKDALASNYSGEDNAGAAAVLPDNNQNQAIGALLRERILAKRQADAAQKSVLSDPGMNISKAWERDQEYFLGRLRGYAKTAKNYYNAKNLKPDQRDELQLRMIEEKGRLMNDINESAKHRADFVKWNTEISKNPDDYDPEDIQKLKSFYETGYEDRDREFSPTKGSSVNVYKFLQSVDVPTYTRTVKTKDENGELHERVEQYIPAGELKEVAKRLAGGEDKNMRVYKREYAQIHPGATPEEMEADLAAGLRLANSKLRNVKIDYDAPATRDTSPKLNNDGSRLTVKDVVFNYDITDDNYAKLTFGKSGSDSDNKPLKFQLGHDAKGKPTDEQITGVPRSVVYQKGQDPYIEIVVDEPVMEKRYGIMKKVGTKPVTKHVPGTVDNMRLIDQNYRMPAADARQMLLPAAIKQWNARKAREGATAGRPALTPDQKKAAGVSSNNKIGRKPVGL